MIDPPPAPMLDTAIVGISRGNSAMGSSELSTGRPPRMTPISALVPPTSRVIRSAASHPASDARQNTGAGLRQPTRHLEAMQLARSGVEYQIGKRPADVGPKKAG